MASPSPRQSPVMGEKRIDRDHTTLQPLSKRDKKRSQLVERIDEIIKAFSRNKDNEYRAQLQAIQVDINIILSTDPHDTHRVLDEHAQEVINLLMGYRGGTAEELREQLKNLDNLPTPGAIYAEFSQAVKNAEEDRDAALTIHARDHDSKVQDLQYSNMFMMKLAKEEHKTLASSLRDRLINSINSRKNRLAREKESTEIGESNALLMHPNQYTLVNPASPGVHSKRATRHRREMEDVNGYSDSYKRKRKALDDAGSPAPSRRLLDNGQAPIWTPGDIIKSSMNGATPLYSIDKLFTERELASNYNTAAIAAHQYIVNHKFDNDPIEAEDDSSSGNDEGFSTPAAAATMMERQPSHLTRSTRGDHHRNNNVTASGIEAISDINAPGNFNRIAQQLPKLPPAASLQMAKPYIKETANTPYGVTGDETGRDMARMQKAIEMSAKEGEVGANLFDEELNDLDLLKAATTEPGEGPVGWIRLGTGMVAGAEKGKGREDSELS